ncbi:MAG: sigma 54-interacting transcriptional regulator [Candidatus Cloacimonadota bacterium]|nr:sigma 54-interacting transcriptional regulator [Candidatus Cloacimonadota bacterium]
MENKIEKLIKLAGKESKRSTDDKYKFAKEAFKLAQKIENETDKAEILKNIGKIFHDLFKQNESNDAFLQALNIYENFNEKINIVNCYYYIGFNYSRMVNVKKALEYLTLTFNATSETDKSEFHINSAMYIGRLYMEFGDFEKSFEYLFYSLKYNKKIDNKRNIAETYSKIATGYNLLGLYDKALEYHLKTIEILEKLDKKEIILSVIYNDIGTTYMNSKNYEFALEYFNRSLTEFNKCSTNSYSLSNIGTIYTDQKKYDLALEYHLKAYESAKDFKDEYITPYIQLNLATVYSKMEEYEKTTEYLKKAIEFAEKQKINKMLQEIYKTAKSIYFEMGNYKTAYEFQEKYYDLKVSTLSKNKSTDITEIESKHVNITNESASNDEQEDFSEIIGSSKEMKEIFTLLDMVSEHNVNVLITGPTGCGKELVAKEIHKKYKKDSPFIAINCSAIPDHLLESELFGYAKGAFTGAVKDKRGKIELANGGTLFLDEIGDMPLSLQAKMLRVFQERTVTPLGSTKVIPVSMRIISATNKNLPEMIKNGEFRQDLFYRLKVIKVKMPALKEHKHDIPLLVNHFIRKFNKKFEKKIKSISINALNYLLSCEWQGNVRELENEIERAVLLSKEEILKIELFAQIIEKEETSIFENLPQNWKEYQSYKSEINDKLDVGYVKELMVAADENVQSAGKLGGLERAQIYRLLKKKL